MTTTRKKRRASTPPPDDESKDDGDGDDNNNNRLGRVHAWCYDELDYHRVRFKASADAVIGERNRHMRLRSMDEARCAAEWFKATMFFGVRPEDNGQFSAFTYVRSDGLFALKPIEGMHDSALQAARAHDANEPRPQRRNFRAEAMAAAEAADAAKRKAAKTNAPTARQVAFARTHMRRLELLAMAQIRTGKRDAALRTLQAWVNLCLVKPVARDKHALLSCVFASLQSALVVGAQAYGTGGADAVGFVKAMLAVARTVSSNFEPAIRGDHGRCAFYSAALLHALAVDAGDVEAALQHATELTSKQPFSSMADMHVTRASLHLVAHRAPHRSAQDAETDLGKAGAAAALALQLDARNPAALALVAEVCALSHRLLGTAAVPALAAACARALDEDDNAAVALAADVLVADATVPESTQMRALLRLAVGGRCDAVVEACRRTDAARLAEAVFPLGQASVHCLSALPNALCAADVRGGGTGNASVVAVWRILAVCMERLSASAALLDKLVDVARNELGRFFVVRAATAPVLSNEAAFRALVAFRVAPAYYEQCCTHLRAKMHDVLTKAMAVGGMEWLFVA